MRVPAYLNHYTTLSVMIHSLVTKRLGLRTPELWDDKNDAHYLERYAQEKGFKIIRAICFTTVREKFHHWKCFADGGKGVCVEIDTDALLKRIPSNSGFRARKVRYRYIEDLEKERPSVNQWPFLKRLPFADEREFRIIFQSKDPKDETDSVAFPISSIRRITLSPWISKPVSASVKEVLKSIRGCENLNIYNSSLLESARWRKAIAGSEAADDVLTM